MADPPPGSSRPRQGDEDDVAQGILSEGGDADPSDLALGAHPLVLGRVFQVVGILEVGHESLPE